MPVTRRLPVLGLLLAAVGLTLGGCVSLPWYPVGGPYTAEADGFSAELPEGWMRLNSKEDLLITRDGPLLQHVLVERIPFGHPLRHTKKTLAKGMLPQELAEVLLDNVASSEAVLDLKVQENRPARVAGRDGFRVVYTHRSKDGLRFRSILHGVVAGDALYGIRYTAAERYYFQKDLGAYQRVLGSFTLLRPA